MKTKTFEILSLFAFIFALLFGSLSLFYLDYSAGTAILVISILALLFLILLGVVGIVLSISNLIFIQRLYNSSRHNE